MTCMGSVPRPQEVARALARLFEHMPVAQYVLDTDLRIVSVTGKAVDISGFDAEGVVGMSLLELFKVPGPEHPVAIAYASALRGESVSFETEQFGRAYEINLEPIRDDDGTITGVLGFAVDRTEERVVRRALERSDNSAARAQRLAQLGHWDFNVKTNVLWSSAEMLRLYGFAPNETPTHQDYLQRIHVEDRDAVEQSFMTAIRNRCEGFACEYRISRPDGSESWATQQFEMVLNREGKLRRMSGTVLDVTERKRLEEHLRQMALSDSLTGLPNRACLTQRLEELLASGEATGSMALLFIDLDRFKAVNDTMGHAAGDTLLQKMVARISQSLRASDFLARAGGDEFVVLLTKVTDRDEPMAIARRIVEVCTPPVMVGNREAVCTASIGISLFPDDGETVDDLLRNADTAMYAAKSSGRNGASFYTSSMHVAASEHLTLENDLRRALERDELFVQYQPVVDADGVIRSLEALVRWNHPERGVLAPTVFIPIAEENGTIVRLGYWVMQAACRDLVRFRRLAPQLTVAVNLSARQLECDELCAKLAQIADDAHLTMDALTFEVTETVAMTHVELAVETLGALKRLGAGVSIDDFGTGYSSLSSLKRLPIDTVKIDRSFIGDIPGDSDDCAIVAAIMALAGSLGLDVIAEGIETAAQHAFLRSHGCHLMQGFLMGRPAGADATLALLGAAVQNAGKTGDAGCEAAS